MSKPETESPIEELKQKLDTPNVDVSQTFSRTGFHQEVHDAPADWAHDHGDTGNLLTRMRFTKKHKRLAMWLFIAAATFFIFTVLTAFFYLTGSRNILTNEKIDLKVTGPTKVAAGEALPLAIEIKNNNASTLEVTDLLIEYPAGSRSAEDVTVPLLRVRMGLGDVSPGERVATTSSAIIFGEEGTKQQVVVSLEYRVAGSNAIFVKERAFEVEIDDSPVHLLIDAPNTVNSGNDITLEVTVKSNSPAPLENVILKADYPFGFKFASATPKPSFSETVWAIGDLPPQGEKKIILKGTLDGQNDEERIFRFEIGVARNDGDLTNIGTSFADAEHTINIARPFVDLTFSVDGQTGNVLTVPAGKDVELNVMWRNNLSDRLGDAVLELVITGQGIDEKTIKSSSGFYNSSSNTLTWDKRTENDFSVLEAGDSGRVSVRFSTLSSQAMAGKNINPEIQLAVSLKGVPIGNSDAPELIRTDAHGILKIGTNAALSTIVLHDSGPIDNSGPMPPKAEKETTYTVVWNIGTSVNDITNAVVRGKLPPYVEWKNVTLPADEDVTYDAATGMITWDAGTVRAGAGYQSPTRALVFQIGLTPSVNQIGSTPILIEDTTLTAKDGFSGTAISDTEEAQTTLLSDDPTFDGDEDRVVD